MFAGSDGLARIVACVGEDGTNLEFDQHPLGAETLGGMIADLTEPLPVLVGD